MRYLVQELGLAEDDEPVVTKYPGDRYKLSTDPEEIAPYRERLTEEEWHGEIKATAARTSKPGTAVPAEEAIARIRKIRA